MLGTLYAKLIGAGLLLAFLGGLFLWGHHIGASSVQAKWNAAQIVQKAAVAEAQMHADAEATAMRDNFNALSAKYEKAVNAQVPAIADSVATGVTGGSLRLRDAAVCPSGGNVTAATARSRALDAAATQALADRVANSIAAVRAGDAADARERQLDAQVIGLQGVLNAERKH